MKKNIKHLASAGAFAFFLAIAMGSMDDKKEKSETSETSTATANGEAKSNYKKLGETLPTDYFDVTVNKVSVENSVNTGNQFGDLKQEAGTRYLIINTSFKNNSNESRMLIDGEVLVNYNGKDYIFDKSETVMLEGWGLMLDQINPLTTKTTNLVYKIPSELKGNAYYKPGRSGSNDLIDLGNIE
ncbi:hypothetical protein QFZ37_000552 [Chryseobacterium ginsenosidimutans]|uniref:DUF4352 domain-containing protein n=1 Tax=Chryseobacterium ginsenosidimutans TaxID=687846 RepID=UPI0027835690|nr:DUF4352 domain-containing protein [Chryseobacterium ginsenosidimutans]MDQ0592183.1 hypothetical protein [Chryseobacterium ginsenosidimutans]